MVTRYQTASDGRLMPVVVVDNIDGGSGGSGTSASNYQRVIAADDYLKTLNYLDAADAVNRRINTVVHSSALLGLTVTDTYTWAGAAGDYYLQSIQRS